jgi:hypothetical protein
VTVETTADPAPYCLWCSALLDPDDPAGERRLRCRACGAETTYPYPTAAELDRAYEGWYRPASGRFSGPGDRLLRWTRGRLASRLDAVAPPGPILDVGSGDGALLAALRGRGRQAAGTERSSSEDGDGLAGGGWAGVVFWHSLEHLPHPGTQVAQLRGSLRPGGVAVISMPNRDSLQSRLFGDRWLHLDLPRHLLHLPAPTLFRTLSEHGLRIERVSYLRGGQVAFGWLHGLVGALPGHPSLYDAIRRSVARSRPLGAGRSAVTLLAAALLLPSALALTLLEVLLRRGGTVYVEARNV